MPCNLVQSRISDEERAYVVRNAEFVPGGSEGHAPPPLPPIKSILTSVPVLALFAAQALNNWGFSALMNGIPTYLNDVQGLPLDKVTAESGQRWARITIFLIKGQG